MKNKIDENSYKTYDLALVTTLSLFFPIESVEGTNTQRVLFVFRQTNKLNEMVESYWRRDIRVEPQQFFSQLKIIKTRIYSGI